MATKHIPKHLGKYYPAEIRTREEVVIFIPFWGAVGMSLDRHIDFVRSLGFDCYRMNLPSEKEIFQKRFYAGKKKQICEQPWSDEIHGFLKYVPDSKRKILYSFSNISASAIECRVRHKRKDIVGIICDSGPGELSEVELIRIFEIGQKESSQVALSKLFLDFVWPRKFEKSVQKYLRALPKGYPILAIYGSKDGIIPSSKIRRTFSRKVKARVISKMIRGAGHLNGLRDFPRIYCHSVSEFLNAISTARNEHG